ncbi:hypothetical protein BOX15_Mlig033195g1 [Macrostomum lignano]|uniref:LRRcap domain-containing protein n=2 Tax=Macrostomum lignano TaxID=282301 RepID=A0A1I8FZF3_9PLAT|nr:hypothetical protein BOX15_Mlig003790g1 [Macrostomum lignano]PAA87013.1 hypothetical protein BOX15_Mlig033195g1 [Macrostomum lignano]
MSKRVPLQKPAPKSKATAASNSTRPKKKPPKTQSPSSTLPDKDAGTEFGDEFLSSTPPEMLNDHQQDQMEPESAEELQKRLLDRLLSPSSPSDTLCELTHARLDRAELTSIDCFANMWPSNNSVTHLYLQHNKLESLLPGIEYLPNLVFLTVAHNRLTNLTGLASSAPGLRFLDASHNGLTRLEPSTDLPANLFILCLQGNPCRGYRRSVLSRLPRLHQLDLRIVERQSGDDEGAAADSERLPTDSEDDDDDEAGSEDPVDDDVARMLRVARQCLGELDESDIDEDVDDIEDADYEVEDQLDDLGDAGESDGTGGDAAASTSVRRLAADILLRSQSRLETMMSAAAEAAADTERRRREISSAANAGSVAESSTDLE